MKIELHFILLLICVVSCIRAGAKQGKNDGLLTVPELLDKYGYPNQKHTVQTADGYILEMHRLPQKGKRPVLLVHGLLLSSAAFVISGPKNALAYVLYDNGYDVWLGNTRGNRYSKKHIFLTPNVTEFWNFSFHEIGTYDIPAMIDYIIASTRFDKIHYVGHSQGSTGLLVMCHERLGYCNKIHSANLLAPAVYLSYIQSPLMKVLATFTKKFQFFFSGMKEFIPNNGTLQIAGQNVCKDGALIKQLCTNIAFLIFGYNSNKLNQALVPVIVNHVPAGASEKQIIHFAQLIKSGNFQMYDYGFFRNLKKYGKRNPPTYNLKKITAPVAIHYSLNDKFVTKKDILRLFDELPNIFGNNLVPEYNHLDFLFGTNSKTAVYDKVVKSLRMMEK